MEADGVLREVVAQQAAQAQILRGDVAERAHRSAPGHGRATGERAEIDLGVDRGGGQIPVTEHLADLDELGAPTQQLGCQRVAQPVGADLASRHACRRVGSRR